MTTKPSQHEYQRLVEYYMQAPFHQWLGLQYKTIEQGCVELRLETKPEFIGNPLKGVLHGGVEAAALDATGGLQAIMCHYELYAHLPEQEQIAILMNSSTIDMRVDYLRPAKGEFFTLRGALRRRGKNITVISIEMFDDQQKEVALATASYAIAAGHPK